jgi:hypothetical protein
MGNTLSRCLLAIICTVSLFSGAYGQQGSFQWEEIQKSMYDLASDGYELKSAENKYVWEGDSLKISFVTYYLQRGSSLVRLPGGVDFAQCSFLFYPRAASLISSSPEP